MGAHMRILQILSIFTLGLASTSSVAYEEVRELALDASGVASFNIDAGSGSLDIVGVPGAREITLTATIRVPGTSEAKALRKIEEDMTLTLEANSDGAELNARFKSGFFGWGRTRSIDLEVRVPESMTLIIDDGTGSIDIENVRGDLTIDDGTGSLTLINVGGDVDVRDGTGSISISGVGGNISVDDGTGSIDIRGVNGSVTLDDGAGSISVEDVEEDLIIVAEGAGSLTYENVRGSVREPF
jgi:hypothetical protein